ncbi:MAG TPA: VanZ family protein [Longimicrobiales bacterium]|nr:VanZ family protein [Longimicrobiales bacterium]
MSAWSAPPTPSWLSGWDKIAHAGLYTVLGATLAYGKHHATPSPPHWVLVGIGALYGATDEWHQTFVPGRSPDLGDWVADVMGVLLGYTGLLLMLGWLTRREEPGEKGIDVSS